MSDILKGRKIAVLVDNGFEEVELTDPVEALKKEGAEVSIISPQEGKVKAWNHTDWGDEYDVDVKLDSASGDEYDALLLPGGVMNPDFLRVNDKAIKFIKSFNETDKPIGAICHGPWTLIEAGAVEGRKITSFPSIKTDLINAGANWVDEEVVVDGNITTSRKPDDIPVFSRTIIEEFCAKAENEH